MNGQHTKGPWLAAAKPSSVVGWPVVSPAEMGRSVCNVTTGHEQSEANARLIAAAPDLLAAGLAVLNYATLAEILADPKRLDNDVFGIRFGDLRKLSAALAKAQPSTGESR